MFRDHWARLSRARPGRPAVDKAVRDLIRKMSTANPGWGSPRIVGELAKLGIRVAKATAEKYMARPRKPPSPTWRAFLNNHVNLVFVDFFVVPTVSFKVLFVFVVLAHARRRIVHFNITEHPTAQWTAQQISEAFPWEAGPRYLIRDRDLVYGPAFRSRVERMGIEEVLTAPRSPWQNPFAERMIGSIRRECLDNVITSARATSAGSSATISSITTLGVVTACSPWTARRLGRCGPRARGCRGNRGSWRPLPPLRATRGLSRSCRPNVLNFTPRRPRQGEVAPSTLNRLRGGYRSPGLASAPVSALRREAHWTT